MVRRAYARSPYPVPHGEDFRRLFRLAGGDASFVERFHRAAVRRLPFSFSARRDFFVSLITRTQSLDDLLADGELIAEGRFPMLGLCVTDPSHEFDWCHDYLSDRQYPAEPYEQVAFMGGDGSDARYVWELNRGYWIAWLGKAYWVTTNGAWARDFVRLIDSWVRANPVNVGINWAMPMEVGIRAYWLTMGYAFFHGAPGIDDEWWERYLRLLWAHGLYLEGNLEYFSNLTNHYVANLVGQVALGNLFADSERGLQWLRDGRERLVAELRHQVLPDGVHYERSVGYHRLVLEFYLASAVLLDRASLPLPPHALQTIERMSEFVMDYIHPGGAVPQFGDSDDGVLMRLKSNQDLYDHRDTLAVAAAYFQRGDFRAVAGEISQAAVLLLGAEGYERYRALLPRSTARSITYPSGGFAVLRSDRLHVVADIGPIGLHGNNDALSFTVAVDGVPIVIDPGTYCYTRDAAVRNELRATRAHNGPAPESLELAEFDGLWRVKRDSIGMQVDEWHPGKGDGHCTLTARHTAFHAVVPGSSVRRRWTLADDSLEVDDEIVGLEGRTTTVTLTLAPGLTAEHTSEGVAVCAADVPLLLVITNQRIEIVMTWCSPSYGVGVDTLGLRMRIPPDGRLVVQYLCAPYMQKA